MKKVVLCIVMIFMLSGCTNKSEQVTCTLNGKEALFTLKDGIVVKYELDGTDMSKTVIDEINGEYFTSATNNEEGKEILKTYIEGENGNCEL